MRWRVVVCYWRMGRRMGSKAKDIGSIIVSEATSTSKATVRKRALVPTGVGNYAPRAKPQAFPGETVRGVHSQQGCLGAVQLYGRRGLRPEAGHATVIEVGTNRRHSGRIATGG